MARRGLVWSAIGALVSSALIGGSLMAVAGAAPGRPPAPPVETTRHSMGSAFAVSPTLVVTNAHLVLRCREAGLPLTEPGRRGTWRVVHEEADIDLTLLAAPAGSALRPLRLSAARHLAPGAPVMLLGYPRGMADARLLGIPGTVAGETLTVHRPESGRAASLRTRDSAGREVTPTWEDGVAWFGADNATRLRWVVQVAAVTGPGGSGGPVVDAAGAVVGVVFAGGAAGPTFAVPLADLQGFLVRANLLPDFAAPRDGTPDWAGVFGSASDGVVRLTC